MIPVSYTSDARCVYPIVSNMTGCNAEVIRNKL